MQLPALEFHQLWPWILGSLAAALLVSGIDDLLPALICVWGGLRKRPSLIEVGGGQGQSRMAIFVPCWKESGVIENMVRHNLAAIRYRNFDFFLGCYPNDEATVEVAGQLAQAFANVHVALCPHPGPTSKADCLNWIFQRMLLHEEEHSSVFDTVLIHDAEDLIHADELSMVDRAREHYDMIQIPVLPLPTPFHEFTHGIYIDDFSEYQSIDMRARQISGSFIPSNGVGTAFGRTVIDRLAKERGNRIFEPSSLTEDYECGVAIHNLGFKQLFASIKRDCGTVLVTREFFPQSFWSAVRQRTRWVMGIALQSWQKNGWRGPWLQRYWFWRDRKGLITNPLGFLTNVIFLCGAVDWIESRITGREWAFSVSSRTVVILCALTTGIQCLRIGLRMVCVARLFGAFYATGVPIRSVYATAVNCLATLRAVFGYTKARLLGQPLSWQKTEHSYPNREALRFHKRDLAEVLIGAGYIDDQMLTVVRATMPEGMDLADFLVQNRLITEEHICEAMSLQSGVPSGYVDTKRINPNIVRTLPAHIEKRFRVLAFQLRGGRIMIAGPRVPPTTLTEELRSFTHLKVEFQLVTEGNYDQLRRLL